MREKWYVILLCLVVCLVGVLPAEAHEPPRPDEDGVCEEEKRDYVRSQHPDRSDYKLTHLMAYVDTHDYQPILQDPIIKKGMKRLLGSERCHLLENLNVHSSVAIIDGYFVLQGNAPHAGIEERAIMLADMDTAQLHAAIFSQGWIRVFSAADQYDDLPIVVKEWVLVQRMGFVIRDNKPENVHLVWVE